MASGLTGPVDSTHSIDRFIPRADVTERFEIVVNAPAAVVMDVAMNISLRSIPAVRFILWVREKLMGAVPGAWRKAPGLVAKTRALGWSVLAVQPGREYVSGALTQPWKAALEFRPVSPAAFGDFAEPDMVKVAWALEAAPLGPTITLFRTETRAVATDEGARVKLRRYWRFFGIGVAAMRWLMLPELRRQAERRTLAQHAHPAIL